LGGKKERKSAGLGSKNNKNEGRPGSYNFVVKETLNTKNNTK
jgi:hypothetical protein